MAVDFRDEAPAILKDYLICRRKPLTNILLISELFLDF
jgi:hypothetical protein